MTIWQDLRNMAAEVRDRTILELFDANPDRGRDYSVEAGDMRLDYAKTNLDDATRRLLLGLCDVKGLAVLRDAMFAGAVVNQTEGRAVLHTALRNLDGGPVYLDGADVMPGVLETLARMRSFCQAVRDGTMRGAGGAFTDVVNIGIGGSDLGPAMVTRALSPYHDGPRCHFVANVDGADIADTLRPLDPRKTLVIVASKTFTTMETMTNARTARAWMSDGGGTPATQFAAVSTAPDRTRDFGIAPAHVFGFEDWVGGRYSVWGPIGLPVMLAIGADGFDAFLRGAQSMDRHFQAADWSENLPVMLALTGIWHNQVCGYATRAVLPYDQRLQHLPAYLQQLEMESNGKSVDLDGAALDLASGPVVWGAPGTNGQHAFYQLIHQGTAIIPCEFMIAAQGHEPDLEHHHRLLVANCLAQSEALMRGRNLAQARALAVAEGLGGDQLDRLARHRSFPGNRPSITLSYPQLTPFVLGQVVALYEHRVFVEGALLGINSFDQWGVELGKELATSMATLLEGAQTAEDKDSSTAGLIDFIRRHGG